ncbi:hypothetical protein B0H13DRAFT_2404496 [Mycena leptocephala]|nr:hypothetical protein B0H13DRAFT_2404496 [Mycena leptocephala]
MSRPHSQSSYHHHRPSTRRLDPTKPDRMHLRPPSRSARPLRLSKPEHGRPDDVRHLPVHRPSPHPLGPTKPYHRLLGTPARPSTIPRPSPTSAARLEARTRAFGMRAPPARAATTTAPAGPYEIGPQAFRTPSPPLEVPPLPAGPLESGTRAFRMVSVITPPIDHPRPRWIPRSPTADAWERPPAPSMSPHPAPLESRTPAFGMTRLRTPATPSLDVPHRTPAVYHPPAPAAPLEVQTRVFGSGRPPPSMSLHPLKSTQTFGNGLDVPLPPRPSRPYSPLRCSTPHHYRSLRKCVSVRRSEKCSSSRAMELFARYLVLIACTSSIELWLAAPRFCSRLCATTPIRSPPGLDADEDDSVLECTDPAPECEPDPDPDPECDRECLARRWLIDKLRLLARCCSALNENFGDGCVEPESSPSRSCLHSLTSGWCSGSLWMAGWAQGRTTQARPRPIATPPLADLQMSRRHRDRGCTGAHMPLMVLAHIRARSSAGPWTILLGPKKLDRRGLGMPGRPSMSPPAVLLVSQSEPTDGNAGRGPHGRALGVQTLHWVRLHQGYESGFSHEIEMHAGGWACKRQQGGCGWETEEKMSELVLVARQVRRIVYINSLYTLDTRTSVNIYPVSRVKKGEEEVKSKKGNKSKSPPRRVESGGKLVDVPAAGGATASNLGPRLPPTDWCMSEKSSRT